MKIRNTSNELIEDTQRHHHPMHEYGGVDLIESLGALTLYGNLNLIGYKAAFGGNTDWGAGATGTVIDGTGYDWVTQTVGRVNANLNGCAAAAAYHAMTITANQTSSNSIFGTWTELYISNSVDLTGADNFAAIWGQLEAGTGVTLSDTGCFTAGVYANVKAGATLTVPAGHSLNGFRAQIEVSAITNNGTVAAFECLKSGGVDWEYGLYLADVATDIRLHSGSTFVDSADYLTIKAPTGKYTRFGDANTTQHSLDHEDDLMVTGDLEVNATFYPNAITLGGAVAGGDQAFTGVGDMTFTDGSILKSGSGNNNTLILAADDTTCITLTTTGETDTMDLASVWSLVAARNLDIGGYSFRASGLYADGLTSGRVVYTGANGLLSVDSDMTFSTDTLTVTKLGAFQAVGAIDFNSQNMTNVDIDSGTIDGVTITSPNLNEAVALTATATELNLLDLAGMATGEVLVATGAATAAWQSTGITLTAPVIDGTVTGTNLVLPAHSVGGTLAMGANSITLDASQTVDGIDVSAHAAATPYGVHGAGEGARAYHDAAQTIGHNSFTALALNQEDYDTDTIHDLVTNNSHLTCTTAGKYIITGSFYFATDAVGRRIIRIELNGTTYIATHELAPLATETWLTVTTMYDLSATDFVELIAYQTSGGNLDVGAVAGLSPIFSMHRIG